MGAHSFSEKTTQEISAVGRDKIGRRQALITVAILALVTIAILVASLMTGGQPASTPSGSRNPAGIITGTAVPTAINEGTPAGREPRVGDPEAAPMPQSTGVGSPASQHTARPRHVKTRRSASKGTHVSPMPSSKRPVPMPAPSATPVPTPTPTPSATATSPSPSSASTEKERRPHHWWLWSWFDS